jgi:hypothetical protein
MLALWVVSASWLLAERQTVNNTIQYNTIQYNTPDCEKTLEAWRGGERALSLAQRCLALFHTRWRAGTLFTLSPEELAFSTDPASPTLASSVDYIFCAEDAVCYWPQLRTPAEEEARTHGVYGALRTAMEMHSRPDLRALLSTCVSKVQLILSRLRDNSAAGGGMLGRLESTCGFSAADLTALSAMKSLVDVGPTINALVMSALRERAAADVARHGLRNCALQSCNSTEPHPKCYKLCGRCRSAAYCCPAHSVEDWRRHKREQGCTPAGEHAA